MYKLFKLLFSRFKKVLLTKAQKEELVLRYKFEKNMRKLFVSNPIYNKNIKNI